MPIIERQAGAGRQRLLPGQRRLHRPGERGSEQDVNDARAEAAARRRCCSRPTDAFKVKLNYMDQKFEFAGAERRAVRSSTTGEPLFGTYKQNTAPATSRPRSSTSCRRRRSSTGGLGDGDAREQLPGVRAGRDPRPDAHSSARSSTRRSGVAGRHQHGAARISQISTERWAHEFRLTSANNEQLEWLVGPVLHEARRARTSRAPSRHPEPLRPRDAGVPVRVRGERGVRQHDLLLHAAARCDGRHALEQQRHVA